MSICVISLLDGHQCIKLPYILNVKFSVFKNLTSAIVFSIKSSTEYSVLANFDLLFPFLVLTECQHPIFKSMTKAGSGHLQKLKNLGFSRAVLPLFPGLFQGS